MNESDDPFETEDVTPVLQNLFDLLTNLVNDLINPDPKSIRFESDVSRAQLMATAISECQAKIDAVYGAFSLERTSVEYLLITRNQVPSRSDWSGTWCSFFERVIKGYQDEQKFLSNWIEHTEAMASEDCR